MSFIVNGLMRTWVRARIRGRPPLIMPSDDPLYVVDGADPMRVLLIGSGPAAGVGVRSHALGLTGELARAVAVDADRGIEVRSIGQIDLELADVSRLVADADLRQCDALVLVAGTMEVITMLPVESWRSAMGATLAHLRGRLRPDALIVVVGMPRISSIGIGVGWRARLADRRAVLFNDATQQVVRGALAATFVGLPSPTDHAPLPTNEWYRRWAGEIASALLREP